MPILKKIFGRQVGTEYPEGTVLFRVGEQPNHIYSVVSGQVDFYTRDCRKVLSVGPGGFVGIAYLFGCERREMTAITKGPTKLLQLDKKLLTERIHQDPSLAYSIMREMAIRYREIIENLTKPVCEKPNPIQEVHQGADGGFTVGSVNPHVA